MPGSLARVAEHFVANPETSVVFGDAILVDAGGNPLSCRRMVLPRRTRVRFLHLNTLSCAMFLRRSRLKQLAPEPLDNRLSPPFMP